MRAPGDCLSPAQLWGQVRAAVQAARAGLPRIPVTPAQTMAAAALHYIDFVAVIARMHAHDRTALLGRIDALLAHVIQHPWVLPCPTLQQFVDELRHDDVGRHALPFTDPLALPQDAVLNELLRCRLVGVQNQGMELRVHEAGQHRLVVRVHPQHAPQHFAFELDLSPPAPNGPQHGQGQRGPGPSNPLDGDGAQVDSGHFPIVPGGPTP